MHHPAVAVHAQQVAHAPGARRAHAGDVVAGQVHEHDVLGHLLGVGAQLQLQSRVPLVVHVPAPRQAPGAGARDGADGHLAGGRRVQQRGLGGGAQQLEVRRAQVEHVGARVGRAQLVVGGRRVRAGHGEAPRGHHLVHLAGGDGLLHGLDDGRVAVVGQRGDGVDDVGAPGPAAGGRGGRGPVVGVGSIPAGGDGDRRARVGSAPAVEGVDGGGQLVEAGGQVRLIETGAHEGGPGGGVVDDQDDARVVEEVVGAGVVAHGDVGQGLEGGEVVEGDDAGLQGQVRVVDLGAGQDAQGRDGGGGGEALALLQGAVVGGGRDGEGQRVRGRAARAGPGDDVVGQGLAQAGQGGPAVGGGLGEGLDGDGRALAGQSRAGLEDGDGGARDLGGDVDALQQDGVQRTGAGAVVGGGGDETGGGEVLQKAPAVVGVADRPRQDGGRPKRHVVPSCRCHQDSPRACEEPAWWRARGSGAGLRGMSGSPIGEPPPLAGAERCHGTSLGAGGGDDQIVARVRVPS